MWNHILGFLFLAFLLFCAFTLGQYYQINYMLKHPESVATKQVVDKNCIKL